MRTPGFLQATSITVTTRVVMTLKRVNIQLSEELHTRAKLISVLRKTTLNDYLAEAIAKALEKDQGILNGLELDTKRRRGQ